MQEPKRPRPDTGGVITSLMGPVTVPPFGYGTTGGIPSSMSAMGRIAGGNVGLMNYAEPRRINVKWEVPAFFNGTVPLLKDISKHEVVFIRPAQNDPFWMERRSSERGMRQVLGMSPRLLNKVLYHRSMTDQYENITPTSVAREFKLAGVCHTDLTENSTGSSRVLATDLTADNVLVKNYWDDYVSCDNLIGWLICRMTVQPDASVYYDASSDSLLRLQYYNSHHGRKLNTVVRVVPFIVAPGTSFPNREHACSAHDIGDGTPELQENHFLPLGPVVRVNFRLTKQSRGNPASKRFNNPNLPLMTRAFSEKDDKDNVSKTVEVRLNMI